MNNNWTLSKIFWTGLGIIVGFWLIKTILLATMALVFKLVIPALVIGAIVYAVLRVSKGKALGGSNRRPLP